MRVSEKCIVHFRDTVKLPNNKNKGCNKATGTRYA